MEERDKGKALRSRQLIRVPHIKVTAQAAGGNPELEKILFFK